MKKHYLIPAISGVALTMTAATVSAEHNGSWYVDEDDQTVFNVPATQQPTHSSQQPDTIPAASNARWYIDDDDSLVVRVPGSRSGSQSHTMAASGEQPQAERNANWYIDDNYTLVVNVPGSRNKYTNM